MEVAASGFAVEIWLLGSERLVDESGKVVTEREFLQESLGHNAPHDKQMFFGEDREQPNGKWPVEDDLTFLRHARRFAAVPDEPFIEDFAFELIRRRRLERAEIKAIAKRHSLIF